MCQPSGALVVVWLGWLQRKCYEAFSGMGAAASPYGTLRLP
jgi:hypothetical protein